MDRSTTSKHGNAGGKEPDSNERIVIGIAWYRPEQWDRLLRISRDADDLEASHAEWLSHATGEITKLRAAGHEVEKVDVDLDDLVKWCNSRRIAIDGKARAEYVADRLRKAQIRSQSGSSRR